MSWGAEGGEATNRRERREKREEYRLGKRGRSRGMRGVLEGRKEGRVITTDRDMEARREVETGRKETEEERGRGEKKK